MRQMKASVICSPPHPLNDSSPPTLPTHAPAHLHVALHPTDSSFMIIFCVITLTAGAD